MNQTLSAEERLFVENVALFAGQDPKVVKDVFWAILITTALQLYEGNNTVILPYLFKLHVELSFIYDTERRDKFVRDKYVVQALPHTKLLFEQFAANKKTFLEKQFKADMKAAIYGELDIPPDAFRVGYA